MKATSILKILNPILFIAVLLQFLGVAAQHFMYADWLLDMHKWIGYSIGLFALLHIAFNWNWFKNNFFKKKKKNPQP